MQRKGAQDIGVGAGTGGVTVAEGRAQSAMAGGILTLLGRELRVRNGVDGAIEDLEQEEDGEPQDEVDEDGPVEDDKGCWAC